MGKLHYERTDLHSQYMGIFTKDYEVGDTITWLGHDNVHGYMYGEEYVCSQGHFELRGDHPVYKKIGKIHMSKVDHNGDLVKSENKKFFNEKETKSDKLLFYIIVALGGCGVIYLILTLTGII